MVHDADRVAWYVVRSALLPCGVGHGRHATWRSASCTRMQGASMMSRSWNMGDTKTWSLGAQQGRYGRFLQGLFRLKLHGFCCCCGLEELAVCDDVGGRRHRTCELESMYARGGVKQHRVGYGGSGRTLSLRHDSKPAQTLQHWGKGAFFLQRHRQACFSSPLSSPVWSAVFSRFPRI